MQSGALRKSDYTRLGKLLVAQRPDVARELRAVYCTPLPHETDLNRIPVLFQSFCQLKELNPSDLLNENNQPGKRSGKDTMYLKTLFVSVILHLYKPEIFTQPPGAMFIMGGICTALTAVLRYKHGSSISRTIRDAELYNRAYADFRQEAERITGLLKEREV